MAKVSDVLSFLIPDGGWVVYGEDWDGVQFIEADPITKTQFDKGVKDYEAFIVNQQATKATEKAALLAKLGITDDEAKLLLS
jgi:hypothetical protein